MRLVIGALVIVCTCVSAIPREAYTDSHLVDLVEVDIEKRTLDSRKFHLNLFGEQVELNLKRTKDFLPPAIKVHFIDVDEDGNQVIDDWSHRTGGAKDLYHDPVTKASILINEHDGRPMMTGSLNEQYVIEPVEGHIDPQSLLLPRTQVKHRVYKTNLTHLSSGYGDYTSGNVFQQPQGENIDKRQIPGKIYPHIHAVADYSQFKFLGSNKQKTLDYIYILYHTAQIAYFSTMTNPVIQSSLHGVTVCESDAACAELNGGKWAYGVYKHVMDGRNIGKFAYQQRARTGSDYDIFFVTTANDICGNPQGDGYDYCIGGFGPMPSACGTYDETYKWYNGGGLLLDKGGYWAFGIAHEVGHIMNMPHDFEPQTYPHVVTCKDRNYIMGDKKNEKNYPGDHWYFSPCSVYYLHVFLLKPESNCLKSPPAWSLTGQWPETAISGRYLSLENQCKNWGDGWRSCQDTSYVNYDVCKNLGCNGSGIGAAGCTKGTPPLEGSTCGPNMYCRTGNCVRIPG